MTNRIEAITLKLESVQATLKSTFNAKMEALAVSVIEWALSKPTIQRVVADEFLLSNPMSRVIEDAVEQEVSGRGEINADDVEGLDNFVNQMLNDFEVEADQVNHLGSEIESRVDDALSNLEVEVDQVNDLDDRIDERVDEKLDEKLDERLRRAIDIGIERQLDEKLEGLVEAVFLQVAAKITKAMQE